MTMNKKGVVPLAGILLILIAIGGTYWFATSGGTVSSPLSATSSDQAQVAAAGCDGIASINAKYNDKDFYKLGTDPATNITVFSKDGES